MIGRSVERPCTSGQCELPQSSVSPKSVDVLCNYLLGRLQVAVSTEKATHDPARTALYDIDSGACVQIAFAGFLSSKCPEPAIIKLPHD